MFTLSATCLAIALADQAGTLTLIEREGRFGSYVSIEDATGVIEIALSWAEANERVTALRERAA